MVQIMNTSQDRKKQVRRAWENMLAGKPVDRAAVSDEVYQSWVRSLKNGVDPYRLKEELFYNREELKDQYRRIGQLSEKYGNIILLMQELSTKTGLQFQLFDQYANSTHMILTKEDISEEGIRPLFPLKEASEKAIGTSAISLAIQTNTPIQLMNHEHFHTNLHQANCSAAPFHDEHGKIIGVLNISSFDKQQSMETLGLATTFTKIFNNQRMIGDMMEELTGYNETLNEIIEYFPKGIIYLDEKKRVDKYNEKIVRMLNLSKDREDGGLADEIQHYVNRIDDAHSLSSDIMNKEIFLNINNENKSFVITTKHIGNSGGSGKGCMILFEETNNIIRLNNTLRGNQAIYTFEDIVTTHPEMQQLKSTAKLVATSLSSILIEGESGTGKELLAQAIHNASDRKDKPFVGINCGAIPQELIESELFGYQPGAFTGALKGGKPGKLEIASGGTLFLDEVESMPLLTQIKLLRALSTNKVSRLGSIRESPIDIRIISATKKDLLEEARKGNFREDFYYRIKIIKLFLPPLRDRIQDIPVLAEHFVNQYSKLYNLQLMGITDDFIAYLAKYTWPGNLRELKNVIERAIVLNHQEKELTPDALPEEIRAAYTENSVENEILSSVKKSYSTSVSILEIAEKTAIKMVVKECHGQISCAASKLGVSRPTIYQKLRKYHLEKTGEVGK